jgi:CHAD domain-containing protein
MIKSTLQPQSLSLVKETQTDNNALTVGTYAQSIIAEQFQAISKQKKGVLADKDPEHLHKMRVAARRLQSALRIFNSALVLPKAAQFKSVHALGKALGVLRDLDVQTAAIQEYYYPMLNASGQKKVQTLLKQLQHDRQSAFEDVEGILTGSRYSKLKTAYENWLQEPQLSAIAQMPLEVVIPDLVSPLLSALLLHPGWWVSNQDQTHSAALHDLRKTCKAVRYQSEFFESFYDSDFQDWIIELKTLQENLGKVQDGYVLLQILHRQKVKLPELEDAIVQHQSQALIDWEQTRQRYLSPQFRRQLYRMVFSISRKSNPTKAEEHHQPEPTNN